MPSVDEQRAAVIAEAREWLRTPYRHRARVKGLQGGVDCATLMVEVYARAGVIESFDVPYYPPDWHLHRASERYMRFFLDRAVEVPGPPERAPLPGDSVLWRFGRAYAHGAIIVDWPEVIHASMEDKMVILARADGGRLAGLKRKFFSPWG